MATTNAAATHLREALNALDEAAYRLTLVSQASAHRTDGLRECAQETRMQVQRLASQLTKRTEDVLEQGEGVRHAFRPVGESTLSRARCAECGLGADSHLRFALSANVARAP